MKVSSKNYKGIEYVQLSELPAEQKERISQTLGEDDLIKILIDERIVRNCIQYRTYERWFDSVYRSVASSPKIERMTESSNVVVSLGKA